MKFGLKTKSSINILIVSDKGVSDPPAPSPGSAAVKGRGFKPFSLGIVKFMRERSLV